MIAKIALVGYLLIFTASYITSNTTAYYSSQQTVSQLIAAGEWEQIEEEVEDELDEVEKADEIEDFEESSLAFITDEDQIIKVCEPLIIRIEIENNGEVAMQEEGIYEVYYVETGDPKEDGEKLELTEGEGIIETLTSGEKIELTHEIHQPGVYIFFAYQHGNDKDQDGVWSNEILIDCELVGTSEDENIEESPTTSQEKIAEESDKLQDQEEQTSDDTEEEIIEDDIENKEINESIDN